MFREKAGHLTSSRTTICSFVSLLTAEWRRQEHHVPSIDGPSVRALQLLKGRAQVMAHDQIDSVYAWVDVASKQISHGEVDMVEDPCGQWCKDKWRAHLPAHEAVASCLEVVRCPLQPLPFAKTEKLRQTELEN